MERRWRGEARRDGGRAEMRSDEVRFSTSSGQSCAKNKTKGSISTGGGGSKSSWLASLFLEEGWILGEARKKKKLETRREVLKSV